MSLTAPFAAEDHVFMVALVTFAIVFAPAWWPLLRPPPKIPGPFLHPEMWQQMPLVGKESVSHNTRRFRCSTKPASIGLLGCKACCITRPTSW